MSYNILKSIAVIAFGILFGYNSMKYFSEPSKDRRLASVHLGKLGFQKNTQSLFQVKANLDQIAQKDEDVSVILVKVEALQNINPGLTYQWNISADVQILDSVQTGELGVFSPNEIKIFELRVRGFSKSQKKFISFEITGDYDQRPVKHEVLVPSRIEDSFEYQIQQSKKQNSGNKLNGFGDSDKHDRFNPKNVVQ